VDRNFVYSGLFRLERVEKEKNGNM
jgi:hypothetical protein